MPSLEMRCISNLLRLLLLPEMGQTARIFISETQILLCSNNLACIVACHCTTVLAKSCPQRSSSFFNVNDATSVA